MLFILVTLFSALTLASVAGWFSIVGIMSIYAGAPMHAALVMGIVLELAKLVTVSWVYRNWDTATWSLRAPLIYAVIALMLATSISVFGFLTKSHLEQGAATIDNTAKVERLDQQIAREKLTILDDEKVITQLDATVNSFIGKDNADRAVTVRRTQAPQRKQLREEIDQSHKKIDNYSDEKLKLTSEVRALQLEVGPIRYISELFYADGDTKSIETAVKMFTLLIVSTLDPLAIILLIAANHSILRLQYEKDKKKASQEQNSENIDRVLSKNTNEARNTVPRTDIKESKEIKQSSNTGVVSSDSVCEVITTKTQPLYVPISTTFSENETLNEKETIQNKEIETEECSVPYSYGVSSSSDVHTASNNLLPNFIENTVQEDTKKDTNMEVNLPAPWAQQTSILNGILGAPVHFIPQLLHENKENKISSVSTLNESIKDITNIGTKLPIIKQHKYPKVYSWLTEFKRV